MSFAETLRKRQAWTLTVGDLAPIGDPLPESTLCARREAVAVPHCMTHFPKNPMCDVCNRAKLFSKRIKSRREPDPESDLPGPSGFGEQVAIDHMVVSKTSGGREFLVLIVCDSFSGIVHAYPAQSKNSDFVHACLRHFVGLRYKNPDTVCRSDCAPELIRAIRDLGWLPESSLPRRWPHNSKCERQIRAFEECCRCSHLQAGFAVLPSLWTITCKYAAVAMSIDKWPLAFGSEFRGADYVLGQLVFYRTKFQGKSKIAPNASPGLMAGWKLEFGLRYKGVLLILDYSALKDKKISVMNVPDREVYVRENMVFPLADLAEKALQKFADPVVAELTDVDPLPVPFVEDSVEARAKSKRVYITFNRIQKLGQTPGCRACLAYTPNHTQACIDRHEEAFGKKDVPREGLLIGEVDDEEDLFRDLEEINPEIVRRDLDELTEWSYEPSIGPPLDEDDDLVPECPPPDVDDHEDITIGISTVIRIATDFEDVVDPALMQESFGEALSGEGVFGCIGAAAQTEQGAKPNSNRHLSAGGNILYEFCCDENSALGRVGSENGVSVIRLCRASIDLADASAINQLCHQVQGTPGCAVHASLECKPWSQWQRLNRKKHPRLAKIIDEQQSQSEELIHSFIQVANIVLDQGGEVSFEWPRYCTGWHSKVLLNWIAERQLLSSVFPGCAVGVTAKDGKPAKKPWRVVTSCRRLAANLSNLRCTHSEHAPLEGQWTRKSAFYPEPLCCLMLQSLFPYAINQHVCSLPCVPFRQHHHRPKSVLGYPCVPLDILMSEMGCNEITTPAYVHKLLDRDVWKGRPEVQAAIDSEKEGLLGNGTWLEDRIRSKDEVVAEAKRLGKKIHIGSLMIIVSVKGYEKDPSEWVIKARIVFRGDAVRDESNQAAVFEELNASAPSSLAGLNFVVAFSLLEGNACTTSDCIKAYVQSVLDSSCPTYVLLPWELVPAHARHVKQPVAPLVKSLYGHPLASASWQNHLTKILSSQLNGYELEQQPSCFYFPSLGLALSVYVDDLTLSGPQKNHKIFWDTLRKSVQCEDPAPLTKVLGRNHLGFQGGIALQSSDFARQCVTLYEEVSGKKVKLARTPHVDEGSLVLEDSESKGCLSYAAAKLVMKYMWLGRISRPDLLVAINACACHITRWSINDDKRIARIAGYIAATAGYSHVMKIRDEPSSLWLSLYADADFGSGPDMKSTSGYVLALEGPNSFAILLWGAKRQRAVSRSTTEAEFVSLSTALFNEAVPLLEMCQLVIHKAMVLRCFEDNQAVLAIVSRGFSSKLKHLSKFHQINVASTCQAFEEDDMILEYIESPRQRADIMTKALPVGSWDSALALLHILDVNVKMQNQIDLT